MPRIIRQAVTRSKDNHPLRWRRGDTKQRRKRNANVSRIFRKRSTVSAKSAKPFLKEYKEGEEIKIVESPPLACLEPACGELVEPVEGLVELLPEGLRELWVPDLRQPEFPQHFR